MKPLIFSVFFASLAIGNSLIAQSGENFKGLVDNLPHDKLGAWVIGSREIDVTTKTRFDEGMGPVIVGACVSVDLEGTLVKAIKTEKESQCLPE
jgi:hypothetical protein